MVEMRMLASVANAPTTEIKDRRWSTLRPDYFALEVTAELYAYMARIVRGGREIPNLMAMATSKHLSENVRSALNTLPNIRVCLAPASFDEQLLVLQTYARGRYLLEQHQAIGAYLNKDQITTEDAEKINIMYADAALYLAKSSTLESVIEGSATNPEMLRAIHKTLHRDRTRQHAIPTGWQVFDELTGGLEPESVTILAANSGGGKSTVALQWFANMYAAGANVTYISLEMAEEVIHERLVACATGCEYRDLVRGTASPEQLAEIEHEFAQRFNNSSAGRYRICCPQDDVTVPQVFGLISGRPTDVVFLDYPGLCVANRDMRSTTEDARLREDVRFSKAYARKHKCAVVLLWQLNDEGNTMYSKGVVHHSHYFLKWTSTKDTRASSNNHFIVEMAKSRSSECRDLYIQADFKRMRMRNVPALPPEAASLSKDRPAVSAPDAGSGWDYMDRNDRRM